MKDFFSGRLVVIVLSAILLCLVMSIFGAVSGGRISPVSNLVNILVTPIQSAVTWVGDGISSVNARWNSYDEVLSQNRELKVELAETKQKLRDAEKAEQENKLLRAALGLNQRQRDYVIENAEIIAKSTENWTNTFTINKGSLSGIKVDNCVITDEGMVGFVSEVGTNWATVTSVTDSAMEASVIVSRTREVASAEGDFELMKQGFFKLSYLAKDTQVVKGDTIETSGFGGLFPKGMVIGVVEEVKTESHGISKYAVVRPAVDPNKVNHVLVIKDFTLTE